MLDDRNLKDTWITVENSFYPAVRKQHNKWCAQHQFWIYWYVFIETNRATFKDTTVNQWTNFAERMRNLYDEEQIFDLKKDTWGIMKTYVVFGDKLRGGFELDTELKK